MTEANTQAAPEPAPVGSRNGRPIDLWLNVAVALLVVAVLALAGWFGYNVWVDYQRNQQTNAPNRVVKALQEQVRNSPNDVILRVRLGEALGAAGKYPQAIEQLNQALKLDPNHIGAYLDLGMIAMLTEEDEKAERYFNKVVELTEKGNFSNVDERRENAYYNLGLLHLRQRNYEQSAGYFKAALRIRKDASDTYLNLGRALRGMEDYDAAVQNIEIALSFDPGFAEAHFTLGEVYRDQKDDVNASYHFQRAAELAPEAEQPQEALAAFGTSEEWVSRAEKALATGEVEEALTAVLVARNLDPQNFGAAKLHAEVLLERDDLKNAFDVYLQAQAIDKKDPDVKAAIAKIEKDNPKVALSVYSAKLKEDKGNATLKKKVAALKKAAAQ